MQEQKYSSAAFFAANLKALRNARGMTQREFASEMGVPAGMVGTWETGRTLPRPKNIERICRFFAVDLQRILTANPGAGEALPSPASGAGQPGESPLAARIREFVDQLIRAAAGDEATLGWVLVEMKSRFGSVAGSPTYSLNDRPGTGSQFAAAVRQLARAESARRRSAAPPTPETSAPPPPAPPVATEEHPAKTRATAPNEPSWKS